MIMRDAFLVLAGILCAVAVFCVMVVQLEKVLPGKSYDERQMQVRGRAYRFSHWTTFLYFLVAAVILIPQVETGEIKVEGYLLIFGGIMLQTISFHCYCLLNHAALPLGQKPLPAILGYVVNGVIWLGMTVMGQDHWEGMPLTGQGSAKWIYLLTGVTFLALAAMHLIRLLWKEKEE